MYIHTTYVHMHLILKILLKFNSVNFDMFYVPVRLLTTFCVLLFAIVKSSCGLINLEPSTKQIGRVVGGTNSDIDSAPFIVSLQHKSIHYCAGSLINKNWILTAAHCLSKSNQVRETTLVAGSICVAGTSATTQKRTIDYYLIHHLYLGGTSPYDVGLVYTKNSFIWTNAVRAITLPSSGYTPAGSAFLYGWGSTSNTNNPLYPSTLQVATVPIISLKSCESAMGSKGNDVHDTNICTGPLSGGVSICTSDSGGPLVQIIKGNNILVGIVSWGKIPCGQKNSPSVYVNVLSILSWIEKNQVVPK